MKNDPEKLKLERSAKDLDTTPEKLKFLFNVEGILKSGKDLSDPEWDIMLDFYHDSKTRAIALGMMSFFKNSRFKNNCIQFANANVDSADAACSSNSLRVLYSLGSPNWKEECTRKLSSDKPWVREMSQSLLKMKDTDNAKK